MPARFLVPLPHVVRDYDAVFAHPLASALRIAALLKGRSTRAVVLGDTPEALVCAAVLKDSVRSVFVSTSSRRAEDAFSRHGIHVDPGGRFQTVVDASFSQEGVLGALRRVEPGGILALPSFGAPLPSVPLGSALFPEVTVIGAGPAPVTQAIDRLRDKSLCELLSKLRPDVFPFADATAAFDTLRSTSMFVLLDNLASLASSSRRNSMHTRPGEEGS